MAKKTYKKRNYWKSLPKVGSTIALTVAMASVLATPANASEVDEAVLAEENVQLIPLVEEELLRERERQEEMKQVMRRAYNREYEEYICVDAVGELIRPRYVTEHFQVLLKQNGLRRIRFHDLRHSTASLLLSRGVPMKMIQDWLGHSDMGTTANIYSHIDSESKKASAAAIGDALR